MADLLIFDRFDQLLTILSNQAEGACSFWDAPFKEELNIGSSFSFVTVGDHVDSVHVVAENQVAFRDKDGYFRLFAIREVERTDGENGPEITAICESAMLELNDEVIEDERPYDTTLADALDRALDQTRWQSGITADFGYNSTNFYYISVTTAINQIIHTWGGELRDRVEIDGNKIIGRYIDILPRRGQDTGKRWEIDKDIVKITHQVQSYPKTALYGRGKSLETENGGWTRKIDFADVEWSVANGDPVDKLLGQKWVGDPDALATYGRLDSDGVTLRHRFGLYEDDSEDPAQLLANTWSDLQQRQLPFANYQMDVALMASLTGYEHEAVRLGDTTFAIDRNFAQPIETEERIIVFEYDVSDPDNSGKVELGQFIDLYRDEERLDQVETIVQDKAPIWDQPPVVTDDSFPDEMPPVPTGIVVEGLFKLIKINWDYNPESYIAAYEVYASQIQGFVPAPENLIYRGKTSGILFEAQTNQQWYFRLRSINTHGTTSDYSDEFTANTVTINAAIDVAPLTITNELIAEGISADKITTGILQAIQLLGVEIVGSTIRSSSGNFVMDESGIKVKLIEGGRELGYTSITPSEFAGYWDQSGAGDFEKVFYLNGDETVSKKFRAKEEITLGSVKIVRVEAGGNMGWALVPIIPVED